MHVKVSRQKLNANDNAGISNIFNISAQTMTRQIWLQLLFIIKIGTALIQVGRAGLLQLGHFYVYG